MKKSKTKIKFIYKVLNNDNKIVALEKIDLVFSNKETKKPIRCPEHILELL